MDEGMDKEILTTLKKIKNNRKKRALIGAFLISTSIILSEITGFIFIGALDVEKSIGLELLMISLAFLCMGIYLIVHTPPIIID
jgi:uncharacterized membrane protein